ncbi:MAG: bifunctional YncE family protein/alkaline phosphatase family protein [Armatimonadota bacterium]|nr:bifunctional YncE family protein/alkaline phosphatase family protein [Armatimonadota bacterium]
MRFPFRTLFAAALAVSLSGPRLGATQLPNGWQLTPAGRHIALPGDLPLTMVVSPDGKSLLVNTGGWHNQSISVIDMASERVTQSVDVDKNWAGLCFDAAGANVYVASGQGYDAATAAKAVQAGMSAARVASMKRSVLRFAWDGSGLAPLPALVVPPLEGKERFTAGLASGKDGALYIIDMEGDTVYKMGGSPLTVQGSVKVGYRPLALAMSPDGNTVAVSNWGAQSVSLLDGRTMKETARVSVGSHPNALVWGKDGRLFVANAGSDSVSVVARYQVVHTNDDKTTRVVREGASVLETLKTSLGAADPVGSTPVALAVSADETRLYVANADNNDVAVYDTSNVRGSRLLGFIPTAWYPSALAVSPDGKKLYIGTGKGLRSRPSVPAIAPDPRTTYDGQRKYDYIGRILSGGVAVVDVPDATKLASYTQQVMANVPRVVPNAALPVGKIKHVLYVIRENRSYDQILGDVAAGEGDSSLTQFGRNITPNAHALAQNFALLDNFYADGEVAEDGHKWCDAAYATDFIQKAWPSNYSDRDEPSADERLTASPAGSLWGNCARHGVSYLSYGEEAGRAGSAFVGDKGLIGHASEAWTRVPAEAHDTTRAAVFLADLKRAEASGVWPQFMVMALGEDHTQGLTPGKYTPMAHVAANDMALGQIVEGVSKSRFWASTAIFVVEDCAQDGPDHIDAHRTVGLVISPFVKRKAVDSAHYTTASFVRTIEDLLKLPPMTQFDARATPLSGVFGPKPDLRPFTALAARVDTEARNP